MISSLLSIAYSLCIVASSGEVGTSELLSEAAPAFAASVRADSAHETQSAAAKAGSIPWARVRPPASFVSVRLPKENEDESGVRDTIVGDIEHTTISADPTEEVDVSITVTELPSAVTMFTTNEMLLRKAKRELLKANSGEETGWGGSKSGEEEGRTLRYRTTDGREGYAELYIDDGVLVVLNAIYPEDEFAPARKFFSSKSFH